MYAPENIASGAYGFLELECWFKPCDGVVWRELFYCAVGLALFFASDAFLDQSLVEEEEEVEPTPAEVVEGSATDRRRGQQQGLSSSDDGAAGNGGGGPSRLSVTLRCFVALVGAIVHNSE
jgi:hypothetical protein